jgi:para-aminobenzoate synthetase component 1
VNQNKVESKPIKGTRPRSNNLTIDKQQINNLQTSLKDRAENVMIVDLLRNDISRTCKIGSVNVPSLFDIESYATVHHLVSSIQGTLDKNKDSIELLKTCFPGGSITGAPKIRAMEIIESLEPQRRGIYCGSIGYIDFNGNMDTNIAIRTLVYNQNTIRFWVGGGIVYDSELNAEYQEALDKGKALLELLTLYRQ